METSGPVRVASGKANIPAWCEGPHGIPLQLLPGPRSCTGVEAGTSVFLSSEDMELWVNLEFPEGSQASSRVETCKSALLSSQKSIVRLSVELT